MASKRHFCRIQIGASTRINQQTKERMKTFFNEILTVMETIQPGEEKTLEFFQSSENASFDDNILIDVIISKDTPASQGVYPFYTIFKKIFKYWITIKNIAIFFIS
jgi:hypothetical protein